MNTKRTIDGDDLLRRIRRANEEAERDLSDVSDECGDMRDDFDRGYDSGYVSGIKDVYWLVREIVGND